MIGNTLNDTVTKEYVENILEQCRYFAEACDYLSTIEIYTQPHGGYSGITASILPLLREEFGNSICIPIWSIDDDTYDNDSNNAINNSSNTSVLSLETMKEKLYVLDTILFYNQTLEYCDITIPISYQNILDNIPSLDIKNQQYNKYISSSIAAIAIDAANIYNTLPICNIEEQVEIYPTLRKQQSSSYNNSNSNNNTSNNRSNSSNSYNSDSISNICIENTHQWCNTITQQGKFPLCTLELGFPGIFSPNKYYNNNSNHMLSNNNSSSNLDQYHSLDQFIIDSLDDYNISINNKEVEEYSKQLVINPFTLSISPLNNIKILKSTNNTIESKSYSSIKAYTNLISVRGSSNKCNIIIIIIK